MAHVSATIPWEEGKEEDFKELREGLEKLRAGEELVKDRSDSEDSDTCEKLEEYHKYEDSDTEDVDDPEEDEDPGADKPGERLLWAAQHNHLSLASSLLSSSPGLVCTKDSDLYTPLHRAAYGDHLDMLYLLLAGGADPLATTDDGWTALHSAARWNCSSCVETLLHHAPVNCTTHGGNTPLHLACQQNHRNTVELLLAHPAINTDMVNMQGDTPRMVAERVGNLGPLFDAVMPRGVRSHKE
eukprot:TRINITY_DN6029_c0_g1_i3.p1 TRINITY_DN6029_c0_g1~~TRINITY_DN6029_c0_g1_i3.p1  ORF type:complete len:242 (+),score=96.44 TRINITY_DN6029_c0_g1_i3:46-771(+)